MARDEEQVVYPKRNSLPEPNTGCVSSIAATFEASTRKRKHHTDPTFGNMEQYDTMLVHYDKENGNLRIWYREQRVQRL